MFVEESVWIRNTLSALSIQAEFQVLGIGSSNLEHRTKIQPHIDENVFKPIEARGARITYLDIKDSLF